MRVVLAIVVCLWAGALWALDPAEMLDDPALEAKARALDHQLRCVVCQSEALASSNADWAREARAVVREQVLAGRSEDEIKAFFVERYGEFVLMDPPRTGSNLILWAAAPVGLLLALIVGVSFIRGRGRAPQQDKLSDIEEARLKEILEE